MLAPLPAEVDHLGNLVRRLLELSRLGQVDLHVELEPAADAARRALDALRRAPDTAALAARVPVQVDALPTLTADPTLLQQVFTNLIGNALRFAGSRDGGHVTVGSGIVDGRSAVFVRDNGPGFDPARVDELFQPFRRLHGPGLSRHGIGLSIVRRIVERHGGRLWAEATPGRGACFWFSLPARG
jgi:signal transduction histidine kinase